MLLGEALKHGVKRLTASRIGSPRMNAEVLLMFTLGCDRAYLFAHPERELTLDEQARFEQVLAERAGGKPSQYITGHQEFWGMDFLVSPAVLVPRPETEHVIEVVLPLARAVRHPRIVDVGTGSGCIALALAKELPHAEIHASDISQPALEIARANAARLNFDARVQFHHGDLLAGFEAASIDFVVSNPPYVGESDIVERQVFEHEPRNAVFAGKTGTEVIERLVPQAKQALKPGGWLVIEIGYSIDAAVREHVLDWNAVNITNDLQGIARVLAVRK
jgi:release factor glutamine methyltransferase